jgi:hypothetical protein
VFCLLVAVALLVVVRVRYWIIDRKKKNGA